MTKLIHELETGVSISFVYRRFKAYFFKYRIYVESVYSIAKTSGFGIQVWLKTLTDPAL